jgi:propanol-preferring alcohol dehydrogenase
MSSATTESRGVAAILTGSYGQPYTFGSLIAAPPSQGEALVRLDYSGVCHGDVYMRDGGGPAPPSPRRPLIGGQEGVGTVIVLGPDSGNGFKVGQRVGIAWRSFVCGDCQACQARSENFCEKQIITGAGRDGTFASTRLTGFMARNGRYADFGEDTSPFQLTTLSPYRSPSSLQPQFALSSAQE